MSGRLHLLHNHWQTQGHQQEGSVSHGRPMLCILEKGCQLCQSQVCLQSMTSLTERQLSRLRHWQGLKESTILDPEHPRLWSGRPPLEGQVASVVCEFSGVPLPTISQHSQDSPFGGVEGDVLLIFGGPIWNCLAQLGRQKSLNVGSPISGQSGHVLLVSQVGSGSSTGCPGACREGCEGRCGVPEASERPLQIALISRCNFLPHPQKPKAVPKEALETQSSLS